MAARRALAGFDLVALGDGPVAATADAAMPPSERSGAGGAPRQGSVLEAGHQGVRAEEVSGG
ncbi:hypothetical protein [Methylobacterium iners]|uniref:hypothetical protein n=1 Tax=Methylobacterium iners TaxID=418707 RepID=UPI001EE313DB|nr:hypothetical protein [Methylobacterium iners]